MGKFWREDPEVTTLKDLMNRESRALQEEETRMRELEGIEKTISETRKQLFNLKRSCTGSVPLGPFYDISKVLHLDPDRLFPSSIKGSEAKNNSAEAKVLVLRTEAVKQRTQTKRKIHRLGEMLRCAGSRPGTLDHEIYRVLKKFSDLDIDVTLDEAIGVALANIYHRTHDASRIRGLAARGRFALHEVGNCAADVVFDPELREKMAKRHKQLGLWGRHMLMKEYLRIAENSADHSTVKAYTIKSDRLNDLPEHILYGLVVCGETHAMRILEVEKDGIRVVEGNFDGHLNFGRYVPFDEITWGENNVIVYSRQPSQRHGLEDEYAPYDYNNPDAVGYESIQESLDDLNSYTYFKLMSEERYARIPLRIRDSLNILRFRPGKSYDITYYADLVDNAHSLFPGRSLEEVVSAFIRIACCNPTGMIVISTITAGQANYQLLSRFRREVPSDAAKQMFVFFNKEGGEEESLYRLREITEPVRREHGDKVPRILLMTIEEFTALEENAKRAAAILTPRRDEKGNHADSESYFEEQLMRVCPNDSSMLVDDHCNQAVSLKELMQNPLGALIVMEMPFNILGLGGRLTEDELSILSKYPVRGSKEGAEKRFLRMLEIRQKK